MKERANRLWRVPTGVQICAAAGLVILMQCRAEACIGSRLIFTFNGGLLFLNIFIGALEGLVAFALFRARPVRAIGIMILANYFSLVAGWPLLEPVTAALEKIIFSAPRILYLRNLVLLTVAVSFALTVIFEMPFCLWLFRGAKRRAAKAVVFCVVSQIVTYSFIGPWMRNWVSRSAHEFETVSDTSSTRNPEAVVYYLENDSGDLYRIRLDGTGKRFVARTAASANTVQLFPAREEGAKSWKLMAITRWPWSEQYILEELEPYCGGALDEFADAYAQGRTDSETGRYIAFDFAEVAGAAGAHRAAVRSGTGWDVTVRRRDSDARSPLEGDRLAYQTPFKVYTWGMPSNLPDDEAVVSVDGQILLLDMRHATLSFLAEGRSPFVIPAPRESVAAAEIAAAAR